MEHPTGDFSSAVDAMTDAFARLRAIDEWGDGITFCAQGMGATPDSYHFAEIQLLHDILKVAVVLDIPAILRQARVSQTALVQSAPYYSIANASPQEAARILDAIFRHTLGIRSFPDDPRDYAVGAEWLST